VYFDGTFVEHQGYLYMLFGAIEDLLRIASPGRKTYSQLGIMSFVVAPGPQLNGFLPGWTIEHEKRMIIIFCERQTNDN
jgi:hypothetical protein